MGIQLLVYLELVQPEMKYGTKHLVEVAVQEVMQFRKRMKVAIFWFAIIIIMEPVLMIFG